MLSEGSDPASAQATIRTKFIKKKNGCLFSVDGWKRNFMVACITSYRGGSSRSAAILRPMAGPKSDRSVDHSADNSADPGRTVRWTIQWISRRTLGGPFGGQPRSLGGTMEEPFGGQLSGSLGGAPLGGPLGKPFGGPLLNRPPLGGLTTRWTKRQAADNLVDSTNHI